MKKTLIILFLLIKSICFGQNKNYCDWTGCKLPKDHEAHFDPYYNGHLCENFNPQQIDFSKEYLKLQTQRISKVALKFTEGISSYSLNTDSIFNTIDYQQNGVIGPNYKRIRIHIYKTEPVSVNKDIFMLYGKSNVNGNICDFKGKVKILDIFEITKDPEIQGQAKLFAEYEFFEDSLQKYTGIFKGIFECSIRIDHSKKKILLDDSFIVADGYYNKTFIGKWTSYDKKVTKKCIWGDNRLPFTFDFDCGDGEMQVCEKYENNGWTTFNKGTEYKEVNGKYTLADKWWKNKNTK